MTMKKLALSRSKSIYRDFFIPPLATVFHPDTYNNAKQQSTKCKKKIIIKNRKKKIIIVTLLG
jgi:hypothetical protein